MTIDPAKLTPEELEIAKTSPILFGLLQKGGVHIEQGVDVPIVTINGQRIELTAQNKQAYQNGGLIGLGFSLRVSGQAASDPAVEALLLGTTDVRGDITQARVAELMGEGKDIEALAALSASMDSALSPEERAAVLTQTGLPYFGPGTNYWNEGIDAALAGPGDTSQGRYGDWDADKVGRWMQGVARNAPPELVNAMLDAVKARYDPHWLVGNGKIGGSSSGVDWFKGLSLSVAVADQIGGHERTLEFARWINSVSVSDGNLMSKLVYDGGGAPLRETVQEGFGSGLLEAIINEYKTNPGAYDEKNVTFLGRDLPTVAAAAGEQEWLKLAMARFDAFNDNKVEMLQSFFDKFQGLGNIGVPISTQNSPQLRNAYGTAAGFVPTQNLDAAARGDDSVDWFGPGTEGAGAPQSAASWQWAVINVAMSWIDNQDDDKSTHHDDDKATATFLPFVYAAKSAGTQNGVLIKIRKSDGSEVIVDGSQADDAYDIARANHKTLDLANPDQDAFVKWHFDGMNDFIDRNDYDTNGKIYIVDDWQTADRDHDGHVDIDPIKDGIDAARVTGGERWKQVGDYAAMGVGLIASLALAPVTAGGSVVAFWTVAAAIAGSAGWQIYRGSDIRNDMAAHGQSTDWDNPAARDTYIMQGMAAASLIPAGFMGRALWVSRAGGLLTKIGETAGNAGIVSRGAAVIDRASLPAQMARYTGFGIMVPAVALTARQAEALAENWDVLSTEQKITGSAELLFNGLSFFSGAIAAHTPWLAGKLAANPRYTHSESAYLNDVAFLREAATRGIKVDPAVGKGSWDRSFAVGKDGETEALLHVTPATTIRAGGEEFGRIQVDPVPAKKAGAEVPDLTWADPVFNGTLLAQDANGARPGNGRKLLAVLPHPDDDSMFAGLLARAFAAGYEVEIIALTGGDSGTQCETKSGVPREIRDATGKEATDPAAYRQIRLAELRNALHLYGAPENVKISFLGQPDINPWRYPLFRLIRYGRFAQWQPEAVTKYVFDRISGAHLGEGETFVPYDAILTTSGDPSGHGAHQEGWLLSTAAVKQLKAENADIQAPQVLGIRETGYLPQSLLEPIPTDRVLTLNLSPAEIARKEYARAKAYQSQPPGHFEYHGNARPFEQFVIEEGSSARAVLAPLLSGEHTPLLLDPAISNPDGTLITTADGVRPNVDYVTLEALGRPKRVEVIAPPPPRIRPAYEGPQASELAGFEARIQEWGEGRGPQIDEVSGAREDQRWYFEKAGPRFRPQRVSLSERRALRGSDDGGFWSGYRHDDVVWVVSPRKPSTNVGANADLLLDGDTLPFRSLAGAREHAVQQIKAGLDEGGPKVWYVYRLTAPGRVLAAEIEAGAIKPGTIEGVLAVREKGALAPETFANRNARYVPKPADGDKPGDVYSEPPPAGLTAKDWVWAGTKTSLIIGLDLAAAYLGVNHFTGGNHLATIDALVRTGLGMFALRATVNGAKEIAQTRLARRIETVGSDDSRPGLDEVRGRLSAWQRILHGVTRAQGDQLLLHGAILKANPRDGDAFSALDDAKTFEPQSPFVKALDVIQALSYGVNDAAGSRVLTNFLFNPATNMFELSFSTLTHAGDTVDHYASIAFLPVHPANNASAIWPRFLGGRRSWQDNKNDTIQAEGARWRSYYRGNDGSRLLQLIQGIGDRSGAVTPETLPDGRRVQKPPLSLRIKQHAMGGATIAAVPFMAADWVRAVDAFASGHPVVGLVQVGMGAFDWVFFHAFQQSYVDVRRANRNNRWIDGLNRPLKGAEVDPVDVTKPRLVNKGFLKTFAPAIVLAFGMDGRVILGYLSPWDEQYGEVADDQVVGAGPFATSRPATIAPEAIANLLGKTVEQEPDFAGDPLDLSPEEFTALLEELGLQGDPFGTA